MPEPTFRPATIADAEAIVRLVTDAYRDVASTVGSTSEHHLLLGQRADAPTVTAAIDDADGEVLLAEADGRLVGCIHVQRSGDAAHFGMFAVAPTRQGTGTGSALLSWAEDLVRDTWGAATMALDVIDRRHELIAWYERRGYRRTGEVLPLPNGDDLSGLPQLDDLHFVVLRRTL